MRSELCKCDICGRMRGLYKEVEYEGKTINFCKKCLKEFSQDKNSFSGVCDKCHNFTNPIIKNFNEVIYRNRLLIKVEPKNLCLKCLREEIDNIERNKDKEIEIPENYNFGAWNSSIEALESDFFKSIDEEYLDKLNKI